MRQGHIPYSAQEIFKALLTAPDADLFWNKEKDKIVLKFDGIKLNSWDAPPGSILNSYMHQCGFVKEN